LSAHKRSYSLTELHTRANEHHHHDLRETGPQPDVTHMSIIRDPLPIMC